jgi:Arc/MetJ family transcription regulator
MQTTVTIDDELYARALELADPNMDKGDLFREVLKTFVRLKAGQRLAALGGTAPDMLDTPRRRPEVEQGNVDMFSGAVVRKDGVTLLVVPEHASDAQQWADGDTLLFSAAPGGLRITRDESDLRRQLALAVEIMAADIEVLRELARR